MLSFIILILVPFVYCADPTPCCTSHQFTATLQETGGYIDPRSGVPTPIDISAQLFYDYDKKLLRADRTTINDDGSVTVAKVIQNHHNMKQYIIVGGQCTAQPLTQPMQEPCVLPNSTFLGTQALGPAGNSVLINTFRMDLRATANMTAKISVTTDDCTPVVFSTYGITNNAQTEITYFFTNYKNGVDPSAFHVPADCHIQSPAGLGK